MQLTTGQLQGVKGLHLPHRGQLSTLMSLSLLEERDCTRRMGGLEGWGDSKDGGTRRMGDSKDGGLQGWGGSKDRSLI